jgi:hypothetical protein
MQQPTDRNPIQQTLNQLIDEGFAATGVLPAYERCVELNRYLRAAIGDLSLRAREEAKQHDERSRDWYRLHNLVRDADIVLKSDLGTGLLSAAIHVSALARQARALSNGVAGH